MIISHSKATPNSSRLRALSLYSNYCFQRFNYVIITSTRQIAIINPQSSHDKSSHMITIPRLPLCHPKTCFIGVACQHEHEHKPTGSRSLGDFKSSNEELVRSLSFLKGNLHDASYDLRLNTMVALPSVS